MKKKIEPFLTPKQQLFCDEYLTDMNATRAALRAGYSVSTALSGALMRLPKVCLYLQQRTEQNAQKLQVTQQMVLGELCKIAFGNMGNYFGKDGQLKPMNKLKPDEAAALGSVTVTEGKNGATTRIRMNSKLSALDKIAKHLQLYDMPPGQPEKEYVYIDRDAFDVNDHFDDPTFRPYKPKPAEEIQREKDEEARWERSRAADRAVKKGRESEVLSGESKDEAHLLATAGENSESGVLSRELKDEEGLLVATPTTPGEKVINKDTVAELLRQNKPTIDPEWLTAKNEVKTPPVKITKAMVREMERKNPNFVPFGKWRDKSDSRYC